MKKTIILIAIILTVILIIVLVGISQKNNIAKSISKFNSRFWRI